MSDPAWNRRAWKSVAGFGIFLLLGSLASVVTALSGIVLGYLAVSSEPPETKATVLAESISLSMNGAAFGLMLGIPGAALLVLALFQLRRA